MQKRILEFIAKQNETVYIQKGLEIKDPFATGLLFVSRMKQRKTDLRDVFVAGIRG
jgi:hypothetical protein